MHKKLLAIMVYFFSALGFTSVGQSETYIDNEKVPVYFNDGDTFKVLRGKYLGKRVRIAGFNTLENYGPVHEWGSMSAVDLYQVANDATSHARKGVWHCTTRQENDTYGRLLADCDDLAIDLISKGLAHAYSIDETPAKNSYLRAQRLAQRNSLGMWRGGVPKFLITSLHSVTTPNNPAYNRLISTLDGHTKIWEHTSNYQTCQTVCLNNERSCMVFVPFETRYGNKRPRCLLINEG